MTGEQTLTLRDVRRAARRLEDANAHFSETLRRAAETTPQRSIAAACGLSKTRVNQIVHGRNR